MNRSVLAWGLRATCAVALLVSAPAGCRRDKPLPPREVVVYCSADQQFAEKVLQDFQERTGIIARARYDTEATKTVALVQRLRSEVEKPTADVFWSSEVFHTIRLAREGVLAPYESEAAKQRPADLVGTEGRWYGFGLRARVIAWNTERVSESEAPRSVEDLLDAKWRGRVVIAAPEFGTSGGGVAAWFAHYGPARAREILRGLKANEVALVDGNSTAVRAIATGQADVCLTDTDDVYAAQRNEWPVAMCALDHGGAGVLAIPNTVGLVAGAPHPESAAALVDYLLGEHAERLLAQTDSHNTPVRPEVAAEFPQYALPKRLPVGFGAIADVLAEAIDATREELR
jgi:iron(III) transport system substrate-binding protein